MAVKTQVSIGDYLRTSFEHDAEYDHGTIVERGAPAFSHSWIQARFCVLFDRYRQEHQLYAVPEIRMGLNAGLVRIPDIGVFAGKPAEIPETPPLVAIEIASPDDRLRPMLEKLAEYRQWGIPNVWLVEPALKSLYSFDGSLTETNVLQLPEYGIRIPASEIFV